MKRLFSITIIIMMVLSMSTIAIAEENTTGKNNDTNSLLASITFDNDVKDDVSGENLTTNGNYSFVAGVLPDTKSLHLENGDGNYVGLKNSLIVGEGDFTVSFWYKGETNENQVIISNKDFSEASN